MTIGEVIGWFRQTLGLIAWLLTPFWVAYFGAHYGGPLDTALITMETTLGTTARIMFSSGLPRRISRRSTLFLPCHSAASVGVDDAGSSLPASNA